MKIKYLLWISLITTITWSISLSAQSPVFSVMVAEGSIKLRQSQSDSIIDMRHGMELHLQDIITLHDNAYLGMVHINSGRTVAFKNPRTIYISDLSKELGEQTMLSKVMSNLVEFFRESKSSFADIVHVSGKSVV